MFHLTTRVAWHENRWNGTVCGSPGSNAYCATLDKIREARQRPGQEEEERRVAGRCFGELKPAELPPCAAEAGAFMNDREWVREFVHPYSDNAKAAATHAHLLPTAVTVPEYATFGVPFRWMLRERQGEIGASVPDQLPDDEKPPFPSPWVFGRDRQEALVNLFFGRLAEERSLAFFYCKEGQPLGDSFTRLVVGMGRITKVGPVLRYKTSPKKKTYPMWDRWFRHSVRPDGTDGFLMPYHDYLVPTGDPAEDARREELLREIAISPDRSNILDFSYGAELTTPDVALSTLTRALAAVTAVKKHGIANGPWDARLDWLNAQIALTWKDRGAFPGLGSALEALGVRYGTALALELVSSGMVKPKDDPWTIVAALLSGKRPPPRDVYAPTLKDARGTWAKLPEGERKLLHLLSRFDVTPDEAERWFDPRKRASLDLQVTTADILRNPYRIAEIDVGDADEPSITVGLVDRGLRPDATIAAAHPVPGPSAVPTPTDERRVRAALVSVLREAADVGDALLSVSEAAARMERLDLPEPCALTSHWLAGHSEFLDGVIRQLDAVVRTGRAAAPEKKIPSLQLAWLEDAEKRVAKVLLARAAKELPIAEKDWRKLLVATVGKQFDPKNARHVEAVSEQVAALERITTRKLTALVGRAGTGKTSVLGALLKCKALAADGILLLAPTGKARVLLEGKTDAEAMTVAQFLHRLKRYDGKRQRPRFTGPDKYRKEKTVVIDECSMLTLDDLLAVLEALDLGHVQRLILVGDPNQLPPIGVGRPFADLVAHLEQGTESGNAVERHLSGALARLSVEVRSASGSSETLRLASWFTREPQPVDADRVLSDIEAGRAGGDLEIRYWQTDQELRHSIQDAMIAHLQMKNRHDVSGFNRALGLDEKGWADFDAPDGIENFQILSPVRMRPYGVCELNRWIQREYRAKQLEQARSPWGTALGDEEIVPGDKVIQLRNGTRDAWNGAELEVYLANGEVGTVCGGKSGFLNVIFARRPGIRVGYHKKRDFGGGSGPLELAYALTVHKAQGSEFRTVFAILPKRCRLLSRELLYTALTRSRSKLVLFIEGADGSALYDLTRPERSETARRNTNLFCGVVRAEEDETPYADHLIHRTDKGHMVRSKSELVIANKLFAMGILYEYERPFEGSVDPHRLRPDFSFVDAAGDVIIWEHLGMLSKHDYAASWAWKRNWYENNGFELGRNLFTTEDDAKGGLDSAKLTATAKAIGSLL